MELFAKIPDVVWSAIIASVLALSGVLMSNRNARLQNLAQLRHDSDQRDREREMELRRDIYLPAIEASSRGLSALTRLANLSVSDQEIGEEFTRDSAALAKIQVVGNNATVQATTRLAEALTTAYLELSLKRVPLSNRVSRLMLLGQFFNESLAEQKRYVDLMKQMTLEGTIDKRTLDILNSNIDFERQQQAEFTREREQLSAQNVSEQMDFVYECLERFMEVSQYLPPAIFALRQELELPIDERAYMKLFNENLERARTVVTSLLRDAVKLSGA